jgi:hypothetical protein
MAQTKKRSGGGSRSGKVSKVLISNTGALKKKYGPVGLALVQKAIAAWMKADAARGIAARFVALDDHKAMAALGGAAVAIATDERATKLAIDAIAKKNGGAALVIVGADDVVVLQRLVNPTWTGSSGDDPDTQVPSDLPYACTAAYSTDARAFTAPTRVVSRLPDMVAAVKPDHLLQNINTAIGWTSHPAAAYVAGFALSAAVWSGSSQASANALFGAKASVELSPPQGPSWKAAALAPRMHFINCHGGAADPQFYGQQGQSYPIAHQAALLPGNVTKGTVVAAECCYGAELYDPALAPPMGICSAYLAQGAYGYMGSSTIAYGPAGTPNGYADLMCQYFLLAIQKGGSIGEALLAARRRYVATSGVLDLVGLKTLAQFHLLGDASIRPIGARTRAGAGQKSVRRGGPTRAADDALEPEKTPVASELQTAAPPPAVAALFRKAAAQHGLQLGESRAAAVAPPMGAHVAAKVTRGARKPATVFHYAFLAPPRAQPKRSGTRPQGPTARNILLVAREENGKVVDEVRELHQK